MSAKAKSGRRKKKKRSLWLPIAFLFFSMIILPVLILVGFYLYFSSDLPRLNSVKDYQPKIVTQVLSENGDIIAEYFVEKRYLIPMDEMPPVLIDAFIAAEDELFFEH